MRLATSCRRPNKAEVHVPTRTPLSPIPMKDNPFSDCPYVSRMATGDPMKRNAHPRLHARPAAGTEVKRLVPHDPRPPRLWRPEIVEESFGHAGPVVNGHAVPPAHHSVVAQHQHVVSGARERDVTSLIRKVSEDIETTLS